MTGRHETEELTRLNEIARASQRIPLIPNLGFKFLELGNGKKQNKIPVYILHIDRIDDHMHGFFTIDNELTNSKIGFSLTDETQNKHYHHICTEMGLEEVEQDKEVLYLPLQLTNSGVNILRRDEKEYYKDSPFPILGLYKTDDQYPLILVSKTYDGVMLNGIYKRKNEINLYEETVPCIGPLEEILRDHTRSSGRKQQEFGKRKVKILRPKVDVKDPESVISYLDQHVIRQDEGKETAAVAVCSWYQMMLAGLEVGPYYHVMLIGPTGSGKTLIFEKLAGLFDIPFIDIKIPSYTSTGYYGSDLIDEFRGLRATTQEEAPLAFVFIDEVDKLAKKDHGGVEGFGPELQKELMGYTGEGGIRLYIGDKNSDKKNNAKDYISTKNMFFGFGGTFQPAGLRDSLIDIIERRLEYGDNELRIGFGADLRKRENQFSEDNYSILSKVDGEDLIEYGLHPELVDRMPNIGVLHNLTVEDKIRILKETEKTALKSTREGFRLKGYSLVLEEPVYRIIAENCTGARGARELSSVCFRLFKKIHRKPGEYAKDKTITITPEFAKEQLKSYSK